jgi:cyclomaltodextrinase / maltogenic alpha-amylase / neopullulanase
VSEPPWVEHAVWWQVYPLGFLGAERAALPPGDQAVHRLPAVTAWLDYLVELGASGLLLGPIFESSTHGYDTVDYLRIDRRLGNEDDFALLVTQAHQRGTRVMLDGVFNHVGRDFPVFQTALVEGRDSPAAAWFRMHWPQSGVGEPEYDHFEGHRQLVTLNHGNPEVVDFVVDVMCHWLDRGADAWRLDAAYAVPAAFWAQVLPRVRDRHPDAYFVGEVIHGDYAAYVAESGVDSITQYELWKAIWSSLNDRNLYELDWTLTRHSELLEELAPLTFVGNHDVTRIASKLDDERLLAHAIVLLLTIGGTPSLYAGDEQGFRGVKEDREGGDDAVRPAFPTDPGLLSPLGRPVFELHQQLIGLRRRNAWLHRAQTHVEHLANEQLVYTSRAGDDALLVVLNLADDSVTVPAPGATGVLAGAGSIADSGATASFTVPPLGWAVLSV